MAGMATPMDVRSCGWGWSGFLTDAALCCHLVQLCVHVQPPDVTLSQGLHSAGAWPVSCNSALTRLWPCSGTTTHVPHRIQLSCKLSLSLRVVYGLNSSLRTVLGQPTKRYRATFDRTSSLLVQSLMLAALIEVVERWLINCTISPGVHIS